MLFRWVVPPSELSMLPNLEINPAFTARSGTWPEASHEEPNPDTEK